MPPPIRAIIVAAGRGVRAGDSPKQFAALAGRTVLWYALRPFAENKSIESVRVVVTAETAEVAARCTEGLPRRSQIEILAAGGATRAASVRGGLRGMADDDRVLIHDAARPCLSDSTLARFLAETADDETGGLLAIPIASALKESADGRARRTLPRGEKYLAQTPQMFRAGMLCAALQNADDCDDDSEAMERAGCAPLIVDGDATNIKITHGEDFALAESILAARAK